MTSVKRPSRGTSLLEMLLAFAILAMVLVPSFYLYQSSRAIVFASGRILDATIIGQTLLEGVTELDPEELPPPSDPRADEWRLLPPSGTPPPGSRFPKIVEHFEAPTPFPMERILVAERAGTAPHDRLILRMVVRFRRIEQDPASEHELVLKTVMMKPR